ncbi:MAG: isochorismate synthase [Solirubrobacterales bacterium]|nr:isochorismate synthase [Solirubrobacterales bacterium]
MPSPLLDRAALGSLIEAGIERAADRGRATLVSVTVPVQCPDPAAVVFAGRRVGEPWFVTEQPDRRTAIAVLGSTRRVTATGPDRFREVAAECAHLSGEAVVLGEETPGPSSGPVWTGGFAFDDRGARTPAWSSFEAAAMTLPEISIQADPAGSSLTVNLMVGEGMDPARSAERITGRVDSLDRSDLGLLDPDPAVPVEVESVLGPEIYEGAVAAAIERIRSGEIEKVVLAREVIVRAGRTHDPAALFAALRRGFPSCFNFCVGTGYATFIGATPELLVRCAGRGVATVGLAGSTRRSSDAAVDAHLAQSLLDSPKDRAEHEVVVKRIVKTLSRESIWVEAAGEPEVIKVANVQHLGTPIYAQLGRPRTAIELAGMLHPTPAVGGEPWEKARRVMAELEDLDRGWYAGPVGWMDGAGDGEFCVALRSALLCDREARLFAGVGVMADSNPADELAETEIKLGALLPLLG